MRADSNPYFQEIESARLDQEPSGWESIEKFLKLIIP